MKKVIGVVAGLLFAGTMITSAVADVTISGDARVRFYYQDSYPLQRGWSPSAFTNVDENHWNSRVRIKVNGDMESGVYARARLTFNSGTWDGTENNTLDFDYAYLGVLFANNITVEAGVLNSTVTDMLLEDETYEGVAIKWSEGVHSIIARYSKQFDEYEEGSDQGEDDTDWFSFKYEGDYESFGLITYIGYGNAAFDAPYPIYAGSGLVGMVRLTTDLGPIALSVDYAYQEAELLGMQQIGDYETLRTNDKDGHMGYITAGMAFGEASYFTAVAGFTADGAVMDSAVGFTMLGGSSQITPSAFSKVGMLDLGQDFGDPFEFNDSGAIPLDTTFVGLIGSHQLNEKVTLGGTIAYADMENDAANANTPFAPILEIDMWEIGASLSYAINADATFSIVAGYASYDLITYDGPGPGELDDDLFGFGADLTITF